MNSMTTESQSISAYGPARPTVDGSPLEPEELQRMLAYWHATLYLSAGMIYLRDNPLLREPLKPEHVKRRLLGHWGSDPGMSLTYIHLNWLIKKYDLNVIYICGPGHGGPGYAFPVRVEQHLCGVETKPPLGIERSGDAISIDLALGDAGDEGVPVMVGPVGPRVEIDHARRRRGIYVIEQ